MIRIVLDTNVLVSGLLRDQGKPARILSLILKKEIQPILDGRILNEYKEVLWRPHLEISENLVKVWLATLNTIGELVLSEPLSHILPDIDDVPFLEVALSGKADALVTGNKKDFGKPPAHLPILTPNEFLEKFFPHLVQ